MEILGAQRTGVSLPLAYVASFRKWVRCGRLEVGCAVYIPCAAGPGDRTDHFQTRATTRLMRIVSMLFKNTNLNANMKCEHGPVHLNMSESEGRRTSRPRSWNRNNKNRGKGMVKGVEDPSREQEKKQRQA